MRWKEQPSQRRRQWWPALCIGLAVQLPLLGLFILQTNHGGPTVADPAEAERMRGQFIALPPKEAPQQDEILDRQLVEVPPTPDTATPPEKAQFQANRVVRVKKQTRSKRRKKPSENKGAQAVDIKNRSAIRSAQSQSASPTTTPQEQKQLALLQPQAKPTPVNPSKSGPRPTLFRGAESRLLLPSTSSKNALANLQALDGGFTTDDHLPQIEESESTLLNADKYRYADFFYRVKDAVRSHWHPASVYRTRDPSGKVYGVKDRNTVLRITLDSKGSVIKVLTQNASGLEFLDQEARDAFRRAQPFTNPPEGLVKDGEINFNFGFYFEISSGRQGFRWKRL